MGLSLGNFFQFSDLDRLQRMPLDDADFTLGQLHIRIRKRNKTWQIIQKAGECGTDEIVAEVEEESIGPDGQRPWLLMGKGRLFFDVTMDRWVLMKNPEKPWTEGTKKDVPLFRACIPYRDCISLFTRHKKNMSYVLTFKSAVRFSLLLGVGFIMGRELIYSYRVKTKIAGYDKGRQMTLRALAKEKSYSGKVHVSPVEDGTDKHAACFLVNAMGFQV